MIRARRPQAMIVLLLAALGILAGSWWATRSSGPPNGPLDPGQSTATSIGVVAGDRVSFGNFILTNTTSRPIVLDAFELLGQTRGVQVLGIRVARAGPDTPHGLVGAVTGYPPLGDRLHPIQGFELQPRLSGQRNDTAQVIVGLVANAAGRWSFRSGRLDYHIDDHHYRITFPDAFSWCAVATPPSRHCKPPTLPKG